jgi:hypothetical protein
MQASEREQAVCEAEARLVALQAQCSQQYLTLRAVHTELQERCVASREGGGAPAGGEEGARPKAS